MIWGGYHQSTEPVQTLNNPYIDIVIRGQGELPFKEVVHKLRNNGSLNGIKGVSFKNGGRIVENPAQEFKSLDQLHRCWNFFRIFLIDLNTFVPE